MTAISWTSTTSGNWGTASNWSTGTVPGAGDDVTINTASSVTVTYSTGTSSILSLYCNGATLDLTGGNLSVLGNATIYSTLNQTAGTFQFAGRTAALSGVVTQSAGATMNVVSGTLTLSGTGNSFSGTLSGATVNFSNGSDTLQSTATLSMQQVMLTGATLTLGKSFTLAGIWSQSSGTLALGGNTLTLAGPSSFDGGVASGTGKISLSGSSEIGGGFALEGSVTLQNSGTLEESSYWYLGYNSTDTSQLVNMAGATLQIDNNSTIYASSGALLTNAGTFTKTGSGFSQINASTTNTGTITIKSGDLRFASGTNSFGGAIGGAGTIDFYSGSDALNSGLALTAATTWLDGATVTLGAALSDANIWNQTSGSLGLGGNTLTLSGTAYLDGGAATGTGTISTTGGGEVSNYYLEGSVILADKGTLTQDGYLYVGYNGTDTAQLEILSGGTYRITGNSIIYGATGGLLTNSGTLIRSSGSGLSQIQVSTTTATGSTTTISSGTLRFDGATNSFSGTINGAGTLELNSGSDSFNSGLSLAVSSILLDGATLSIGGTLSYAGNFSETSGSLALGGHTFTVTGPVSLDGGATTGSGSLKISGGEISYFYLEGSTILSLKSGTTLYQTGNFNIGYNSADTAQFQNAGTLVIENDSSINGPVGALLSNTGTVTKANGAGTSTIYVSVSGGKYVVNSGDLRFAGPSNVFSNQISGIGTAEFYSGTDAFNTGTKLTVDNVLLDGATVTLGLSLTYAHAWTQTNGTIGLGGKTLTLTGTTSLEGGVINGSGTMAVSGGQISTAALEGSVVLQNSGTFAVTSYMYLGYNSSDTAQIANAAGGTLRLDTNATIYSVTGALLTNAGTILKATGGGTSAINASTTSSGTITVNVGVLRFAGSTNSFSGAFTGTGTVELNTGSDTFNSGTTFSVGQMLLDGATVTLGANLSDAGVWSLTAGTIQLGGKTLTLSGTTNLDSGVISGAGTVALSGSTELSGFALEGTAIISNTGTMEAISYWYLGYNSSDTSQLNNQSGGTVILDAGSTIYGTTGALFTNLGTLAKNGSATSDINVSINDTGTTTVNGGTLQFNGSANTFGGIMNGGGTAEFRSGSDTIDSGTVLTIDAVLLDGATLTANTSLSYSGAFSQTSGSLALGGKTFTLSGTVSLDGGITNGAGTLATTGIAEINNGFALEGTTILKNTGTVTQDGTFYVGYNSSDTAQLQNEAGGTFRIVNNATMYGTSGSSITNAGSLIKALGSSTSTINVAVVNTGTVQVAQGGLSFAAAVSGTGSLTENAGTSLYFGAAVASGGTVNMGTDAYLSTSTSLGFADVISGFAVGNVIDWGVGYNSSETLSYNTTTKILTLTNGASNYTLHFTGSYTTSSFHLFNDAGIAGITHS